MKTKVAELRRKGYKVQINHWRYLQGKQGKSHGLVRSFEYPYNQRTAKGGETTATVSAPDGTVRTGAAKCSKNDTYCRAIGVNIALGRALKEIEKSS